MFMVRLKSHWAQIAVALLPLLFAMAAMAMPTASASPARSAGMVRFRAGATTIQPTCDYLVRLAPASGYDATTHYDSAGGFSLAAKSTTGESAATGFRGSEGFELKNAPYQQVRNAGGEVNGQAYSGHAFDQMQNRGIMPSVVQNTIQTGSRFATRAGTTGYYDAVNNVRVIVNSQTGRVVTVIRGAP